MVTVAGPVGMPDVITSEIFADVLFILAQKHMENPVVGPAVR
jgi:hypothetical protein